MLSSILSLSALPLLLSNYSLSTSLNLLFFHLTWSTLVLSHSTLTIELVGSLLIRALFFLLPTTFFLLLHASLPAVTESWKSSSRVKKSRSRRGGGGQGVLKLISVALANILLATLCQAAIEYLVVYALGRKSAVKIAKTLPSPAGALWDLLIAEMMREGLAYAIHRYLLHSHSKSSSWGGRARGYLTKKHNAWAHGSSCGYPSTAATQATSFTSHYDHPIPYLLHHFVPTYLPGTVLRMHILTFFIHLMLISLTEAVGYSGYVDAPTGWIPFGFILGWVTRRVDGHFGSGGKSGYGVWGIADWLGGTRVEVGGEEWVRGGLGRRVERVERVEEVVDGRGRGGRRRKE